MKLRQNVLVHSPNKDYVIAQSCQTLCDPRDHSLPGSSVHGILQARILEWVAISFSKRLHINKKKKPSGKMGSGYVRNIPKEEM